MMMLWAWAGVPLGVYNIVEEFNIALRIQPQILTVLSLITWAQCYHYQSVSVQQPRLVCLTPLTEPQALESSACSGGFLVDRLLDGWC
jgi:hypothetical protein